MTNIKQDNQRVASKILEPRNPPYLEDLTEEENERLITERREGSA